MQAEIDAEATSKAINDDETVINDDADNEKNKDSAYESDKAAIKNVAVDIEYVGEKPSINEKDPNYNYFMKIFETFKVCLCLIDYFSIMKNILIGEISGGIKT